VQASLTMASVLSHKVSVQTKWCRYLGLFVSEEDAAMAYDREVRGCPWGATRCAISLVQLPRTAAKDRRFAAYISEDTKKQIRKD